MGRITCQEELSPTGLLTTVSYDGVPLVAFMGAGSFVDKRLLWQQRMLPPSPQVGSARPDSAHWLEPCHWKLQDRPHETQGRTVSSSPAKTVLSFHACFLSCLTESYVTLTNQSPMPCCVSRRPQAGGCLSDKGSWRLPAFTLCGPSHSSCMQWTLISAESRLVPYPPTMSLKGPGPR